MAVVFDSATNHTRGFGNTVTYAHTVGTNDHRILLAEHNVDGVRVVDTITYAGIPMDLIATQLNPGNTRKYLHYMITPPIGINNVVINWSGNTGWHAGSVSYDGVDPVSPLGTVVTNIDNDNNPRTTVASVAGELVVDAVGFILNSAMNVGGGQTARVNQAGGGGLPGGGSSEEPGAAAVLMNWTIVGGAVQWAAIGVPLKPFSSARGRATKYFFPFWDANPKLFDANGKVVDPSGILADEWVEAEGLGFPTAENPESFIEDPSRSKIIEVNASQASARIKTNTNQFAEVLVSRVAAGS